MKETIQITLSSRIIKKAEERGVDLENFKDTVKTFALLDITARTSKLSKSQAETTSKKIKASSWNKIKKNLKM